MKSKSIEWGRLTILLSCILAMLGAHAECDAQAYRDPSVPTEDRVMDLLSRMTEEEKFWQLFMLAGEFQGDCGRFQNGLYGLQMSVTADSMGLAERANRIQRHFVEETRLGIPVIFFAEALHGLVQEDATVFPQAIALAATFDTELMHGIAHTAAQECRARGVRQVLSPVVNIATDVRWGRTEETYGEDPFLTSEMGMAFVSEFEKSGIIATPKHFVANVGAGGRDSYPIQISERKLREVHLPAFAACIQQGGARSIMTAYNSYDGSPCSASDYLQNQILKRELDFRGVLISDASGVGGANVLHFTASGYPDAGVRALVAGLDVIFQTSFDHYTLFVPPFRDGRIPEAVIDSAVARVLRVKLELGLFEDPYVIPDAWPSLRSPEARQLARRAADESIVLLKNEDQTLPFDAGVRSLAVIGPEADTVRFGGYSAPSAQGITLWDGLQKRAGESISVRYAAGCTRTAHRFVTVPAGALTHIVGESIVPGLRGEYFSNAQLVGSPCFTRTDATIQFDWTFFSPDQEVLSYDDYSVRWIGFLRSPETGHFKLGVDGTDGYRLFLNGTLLIDAWRKISARAKVADVELIADEPQRLCLEFHEPAGNARLKLIWNVGVISEEGAMEHAVDLATQCDAVVLAVGIEEGEFRDRAILSLPGRQGELIQRVSAVGKPVTVVLIGGSAITMAPWLDNVPAVLNAWYPGEQGGSALAGILFGDINPSGRLPITFPQAEGQLPLVYNHKPTGRGDDYVDLTGKPLFPFGYGLSYTSFEYSDLQVDPEIIAAGQGAKVRFALENTGNHDGTEVVQMYIRDKLASVSRPTAELKGFQRVRLEPGARMEVSFMIEPEMLTLLNEDLQPVIEAGEFQIRIGASSQDIRLKGVLAVKER